MRIATVFGTRPEIIRLSETIKVLDGLCEQDLIHTGQNYDPNLSDVFLEQLGVREPDAHFGVRAPTAFGRVSQILEHTAEHFEGKRPDRLLILGDTDSGLSVIVAARMGIPVFHVEAGNRCYDNRVPEEVNRRIIDHCSDVLMPYTHRAKEALLGEGIERRRVFVVGNPIYEVWSAHRDEIEAHRPCVEGDYFVVTMHRAENVDSPVRLTSLWSGLDLVASTYEVPVLVSLHPRTKDRMSEYGIEPRSPYVELLDPLPFFEFAALELDATCVITDSGTVQEECCIFEVPSVTIRDVTERPETVECGSNILVGSSPQSILQGVKAALAIPPHWGAPAEYLESQPSITISRIVTGYHHELA